MRYRRLDLENFGPFLGFNSLDLSTDDARNIIICYGQNGAGKSHLFRAMHFGLYGRVEEDNDLLDPTTLANELRVAEGGSFDMSVTLDVANGDDSFIIKRLIQLEAFDRIAHERGTQKTLMTGGVAQSGATIDPFIERRLPSAVSKFFLFDAELLRRFERDLSFTTGRGLVRENINAILGVPAFQHAQFALSLLSDEADKKVAAKAKSKSAVSAAGRDLEALATQKAAAVKDISSIKEELQGIAIEKLSIDESLRGLGDRERAIGQREEKERQLDSESDRLEEILGQVCEISEGQWFLPLWSEIRRTLEEGRAASEAIRVRRQEWERHAWLSQLVQASIDKGNCALCGHSGDLGSLEAVRARLASEPQVEVAASRGEEILAEAVDALQFAADGETHYQRIVELSKDLVTTRLNIHALTQDISRLNLAIGEHGGEISALNSRRDELVGKEATFTLYLESAQDHLADIEKQIADKRKAIRTVIDDSEDTVRAKITDEVKEIFDQAVTEFQERMRKQVQTRASAVFERLISQKELASLEIASDFSLTVRDRNGEPAPRLSSGQQQVRALSLIAGLFECGVRGAPLVLDTPFARLDPEHLSNILKWIAELDRQVILFVQSNEFSIERDRPLLEDRIAREYTLVPERLRETRIEEGLPARGRKW